MHLPTQYTHPEEEHTSDDLERERRLPAIADVVLRQPRQRLDADAFVHLVRDVELAVAVDVAGAVELNGGFDEGG